MNFKDDLCVNHHLFSSKTSYPTRNFYMFVISSSQSFISQILRVISPLGKKVDFYQSYWI